MFCRLTGSRSVPYAISECAEQARILSSLLPDVRAAALFAIEEDALASRGTHQESIPVGIETNRAGMSAARAEEDIVPIK